jgi:hypothetical protein
VMWQVRNSRGNPRVYFLIPIPIPMNTVPAWVGVWCHRGFSWVTHVYRGLPVLMGGFQDNLYFNI